MNRIIVGAAAALLLVAAGLFWWQGRAEVARGVLPPEISASGAGADGPIALPSADPNHARGAGLPKGAGKPQESEEQKRFNRYDRNRDGKISRPEMLSTRVKAFQKLDTNHDNLLSFEEWAVKTSDRFREIDRNGDGIITRDEFNQWLAAHPKKPKKPGCSSDDTPPPGHKPRGGKPTGEDADTEE
jgi:hypothetical protein